ncbi:MAG: esterase-like activity of phytase family protein, partial [Chromatiaceae bacterium]|nr:esterase-like activity of phytase family protein [Chromatiaceae bacterium]
MTGNPVQGLLLSSLVALGAALSGGPVQAEDAAFAPLASLQEVSFQRIATLANYRNLDAEAIGEETVSEIVAVSQDGNLLVYTDSPGERIGFVDITDPRNPQPAGTLGVGGEPTSVDMVGDRYALAAVNTSASYTDASGKLVVVDVATRTIVQEIALDGQPDSIKVSPDDRYVAIAIENERDEDVEVEGVEGGLPQAPAGYLSIIDILGDSPADWQRRDVDLSGYAFYGSDDPEPEFVDINNDNDVVVSLQENNHILVVDLASGRVQSHFDAGTVDLDEVDATEDGVILPTESLAEVPREPDSIAWVAGSGAQPWLIATANEGDLFGGSRGFTLFDPLGTVVYDSGNSLEWQAIAHGHYPEDRSENKGIEPEAIDYGRFGNEDYLFVGS